MPLIIPVENQVRELDPKLLLACIAARRGFAVIIGSHREVDFRIATLPKSLYINKSMPGRKIWMARDPRNAAVSRMLYRWHKGNLGKKKMIPDPFLSMKFVVIRTTMDARFRKPMYSKKNTCANEK